MLVVPVFVSVVLVLVVLHTSAFISFELKFASYHIHVHVYLLTPVNTIHVHVDQINHAQS